MSFGFDNLISTIRSLVVNEVARVLSGVHPSARPGNIVEYDPTKHAARVRIQPEGIESNWLPVGSDFIGNGFGMVAPLGVDDQVQVLWPEGGNNQGVIGKRLFDSRNGVPTLAQNGKTGEWYLVDAKGSSISFTNDGKFKIGGNVEIDLTTPTVTITCTTACNIKAPLTTIYNSSPGAAKFLMHSDSTACTTVKGE